MLSLAKGFERLEEVVGGRCARRSDERREGRRSSVEVRQGREVMRSLQSLNCFRAQSRYT